jgi:aminoglycoside phosphotransferase family enzyme
MPLPGIEAKVAFLSRPDAYPGGSQGVEIRQTHMSWVFLTDNHAWKLKKPVRTDYVDFRSAEARRRNCLTELRLNRRLAPAVYLGVVELTMDRDGNLCVRGQGTVVDWLVQMRRLPADRMLDTLIARHGVSDQDVSSLASTLTAFYAKAARVSMTGVRYRRRLTSDLEKARRDLTQTGHGVNAALAESVVRSQLDFLEKNEDLFDARAREGRIVEGHGDLRPEHVCLEHQPVVIDCLEFNRNLRILDVLSELSFLALECERLGAPEIGQRLLHAYCERTGDWSSETLLMFYRDYHAAVRAKIAVWHLKDDAILNPAIWTARANQYLELAARVSRAA